MSYDDKHRKGRTESGEIMREPDRGEGRTRTHKVATAGTRRPLDDRYFIPREVFVELFADAPRMDYKQFRAEIDAYVDQDPTPRDWPEP